MSNDCKQVMPFSHQLKCDMGLGGSLKQLIDWELRNRSLADLEDVLVIQLSKRTKTVPIKYGRRCAALIGIIYDELDGNEKLLDMAIRAIKKAEKKLKNE